MKCILFLIDNLWLHLFDVNTVTYLFTFQRQRRLFQKLNKSSKTDDSSTDKTGKHNRKMPGKTSLTKGEEQCRYSVLMILYIHVSLVNSYCTLYRSLATHLHRKYWNAPLFNVFVFTKWWLDILNSLPFCNIISSFC